MAARNRGNALALAVLISLYERPMHPYEIATTLRQRNKHVSVKLNYGSLYAVVTSLEKRGLVTPIETEREGRLPERTIYELTDDGRVEMHDWLAALVSTPEKEYPAFESALSFLPALAPDEAVDLLDERAMRLEFELAAHDAARAMVDKMGLPRLFWIESEYREQHRQAELAYVRTLAADIRSGNLDGVDWWRALYADPDHPPAMPGPPPGDGREGDQ